MQYLLTEEEMQEVRDLRKNAIHPEALKNVVQHVAVKMIDTSPPNGRKPIAEPNGCIHDNFYGRANADYCDACSVAGICPLPKRWSK